MRNRRKREMQRNMEKEAIKKKEEGKGRKVMRKQIHKERELGEVRKNGRKKP